jgi:hypothetical protein
MIKIKIIALCLFLINHPFLYSGFHSECIEVDGDFDIVPLSGISPEDYVVQEYAKQQIPLTNLGRVGALTLVVYKDVSEKTIGLQLLQDQDGDHYTLDIQSPNKLEKMSRLWLETVAGVVPFPNGGLNTFNDFITAEVGNGYKLARFACKFDKINDCARFYVISDYTVGASSSGAPSGWKHSWFGGSTHDKEAACVNSFLDKLKTNNQNCAVCNPTFQKADVIRNPLYGTLN